MNISRLATAACLGVGLTSLSAGALLAQAPAATPAKAPAAAAKTPAAAPKTSVHRPTTGRARLVPQDYVEPEAIRALGTMSAYMRTLTAFQVTMATQRDEVDNYGQTVTFNGETTYKVKMPNNLVVELNDNSRTKRYVYDGKTVTIFDPKTGYYTHFAAPPTIRQTLDAASVQYGINLPLEDLFHWGEGDDEQKGITSAHYVGEATIGGQAVQHFAFRQTGVDWQIWIAKGDKPLPVRVVIVASDDPARPQFQADLTWDAAPEFAADTFVFTPPADAKAIPIVSAAR